jgi:hypothetical protein
VRRLNSVSEALEVLVEPFEVEPDWSAIVRRAVGESTANRGRVARPSWRGALALAFLVVAILAAAAFASGLADRFSAWLNGSPGVPAPAQELRGFAARNRVSLASFPRGTRLRLLRRTIVSGTSFDLLGFQNGDAYCLRLVRTAVPAVAGNTECLRADELQGHVALVAGNAYFSVGKPATSITGVYGFASDSVKVVKVARARKSTTVRVGDNVFLALTGQPQGSVQHHLPPNTVLAVRAVMKDGTLRNVPYVVEGSTPGGILPGGNLPHVPSYFGAPGSNAIPGAPTKVAAPINHPQVAWLAKREERGTPLPSGGPVPYTFGRVIQPDPTEPVRIGLAIAPAMGFSHGRALTGNWVCLIDFVVLGSGGAAGAGCKPDPFGDGPIYVGSDFEEPITRFNGLAADGIARVEAFLASGQRVPAALGDNAFSVAVPEADLPGELVGYDSKGRVAGIAQLPGNAVAKPCPPAELTTPIGQLPARQTWERLDLSTLTVNGARIIGETPAQVRQRLGRPTFVRPKNQTVNGVGVPAYYYGGTTQATFGLDVVFAKRGSKIVANTLIFQSPSLVDAKLGHILRLQPPKLQQLIEGAYSNRYRLLTHYGGSQLTCSGSFADRSSAKGFSFGLDPYRPSRPFLQIAANAGSLP